MNILFYSTKNFEKPFLLKANKLGHSVEFVAEPLSMASAAFAKGFECISIFAGDDASAAVIRELKRVGVRFIAIRAAGYDNVDLEEAGKNTITVANVPGYSPYAIAEHAVALMLALNRKIIQAHRQVQQQNFLLDNLMGFDLNQKTAGIIGTGKIGSVLAGILHGFGCSIVAYDGVRNEQLVSRYGVRYMDLPELCGQSDIISIHVPLTKQTRYMIHEPLIQKMKRGVMIINTARGSVVKTEDIIRYLDNGHIGYYGMDVYEKEKGLFFFDHTGEKLDDPMLQRLMRFENVLITPHQAFVTKEALANIAATTFYSIDSWSRKMRSVHELTGLKESEIVV